MNAPLPAPLPAPADRCPGVLRPHQAADGAMVRIRVPGGQTTGAALRRLSQIAQTYGSGLLQLTSRGSVQLRGLPAVLPDELSAAVAATGLLPSASHERVRNVAVSPLTGLSGGLADLRPMLRELDEGLVADPPLARLPGRFLLVLDDGRGDVAGFALDLGYRALGPDHGMLLVGDGSHGRPVPAAEAVASILVLAHRFLDRREPVWHVRGLAAPLLRDLEPVLAPRSGATPLGPVGPHLSTAAPLGLLSPAQVVVVADAVHDGPLVVTPWRGLVLPGARAAAAGVRAAGLVVDDDSAWQRITACVGAPWCSNGRANTRALGARLAAAGGPAEPTHLSGCERRCGAPSTPHLDLVAPSAADVDRLVGAARV